MDVKVLEGTNRMNQGWIYQDQINRVGAGQTVLEFYAQRYRHSSQAEWQERIAAGQVLLDDKPTTADTLLQPGQRLTYHRPPWEEPEVPLSFETLYEDPDLLVVAKPAGLPVLPGGGFLEHTLLWQLQQRYPHETPLPVHRLGRGTSGLMVMARSPLARASLSQQMRTNTLGKGDRPIHKTYRALVGSSHLADHFTITQPIGKIPHPVLGYVYGATAEGLSAYSECHVYRRTSTTTLLEVTILTGRPHQIRIHLAAVGYPLTGDPFYAAGGIPRLPTNSAEKLPVPGDCGYHLHAHQLSFIHPTGRHPMSFQCPPPTELC